MDFWACYHDNRPSQGKYFNVKYIKAGIHYELWIDIKIQMVVDTLRRENPLEKLAEKHYVYQVYTFDCSYNMLKVRFFRNLEK